MISPPCRRERGTERPRHWPLTTYSRCYRLGGEHNIRERGIAAGECKRVLAALLKYSRRPQIRARTAVERCEGRWDLMKSLLKPPVPVPPTATSCTSVPRLSPPWETGHLPLRGRVMSVTVGVNRDANVCW